MYDVNPWHTNCIHDPHKQPPLAYYFLYTMRMEYDVLFTYVCFHDYVVNPRFIAFRYVFMPFIVPDPASASAP